MNKALLIVVLLLLAPLLLIYLWAGGDACAYCPGGLPLYGWGVALGTLGGAGLVFARWGGRHAYSLLRTAPPSKPAERLTKEQLLKVDPEGPDYPHPVIITERCIGCYQCIEACPHDVLTIRYLKQDE